MNLRQTYFKQLVYWSSNSVVLFLVKTHFMIGQSKRSQKVFFVFFLIKIGSLTIWCNCKSVYVLSVWSRVYVKRIGSETLGKMLVNSKNNSTAMDILFGCLKQQQCLLQMLYYRARSIVPLLKWKGGSNQFSIYQPVAVDDDGAGIFFHAIS